MTEDELKELFRTLEEQGWKPQLCDTPVPLYDVRVPCGPPTELGDTPPEVVMMPKDFLFSLQEFMVTVTGDSMVDADIEEGDVVTVEPNTPIHDGDIVLVMIDGETTLKSYCMDEEGQPWLVPQNTAYNAFRLSESNSVWVMGVVRAVEKRAPRVSYRACIKHIARAKTKMAQPQPLTPAQVSAAIRTVAPMVKAARQWYAVFRVMADADVLRATDYDVFCTQVREAVPDHPRRPAADELQRMAIQSFAKPVARWTPTDAPVQGKRFNDYLSIATRTQELLVQNG